MRVEVEHPGERIDDTRRRGDVAPLLEPRVPGEPDPGQLGDLLAAQTRRAPPPARLQADALGASALSAVAQELREPIAARGWWYESQDQAPSCPVDGLKAGYSP